MEESELIILLREAKAFCSDCFKSSRERLPPGAVCSSPTREQIRESALDTLQKVLSNGNGCSDEAAYAIARCMGCDYHNPEGPGIFEYLRKQMM